MGFWKNEKDYYLVKADFRDPQTLLITPAAWRSAGSQ
jgi:hypothetical protein